MHSCARKECKIEIGSLLFDKYIISWGDIFLGEEKTEMIKLYNPTENKINIKGVFDYSCFYISDRTHEPEKWYTTGIDIMPNSYDSLFISFLTNDTTILGYYRKELRFTLDGQEQYQHLAMDAHVVENFASMTQDELRNAPVVKVDSNEYDLGSMYAGEKKSVSFVIKNEGRLPLIIRKIQTTCGCTVATPDKKVINSGQSTSIEVTFRARGKQGKQHKTITMFCNDPRQPVVTFAIQCFIQN